MATNLRTIICLAILHICLQCLTTGQNVRFEDKLSFEKLLNSPKISSQLRSKLTSSRNHPTASNIVIEFLGGNAIAIYSFEKSQEHSKGTIGREKRISGLVQKLEEHASDSQSDVLDFLKKEGAQYTQLWVSNEIFVKNADARIISKIASSFDSIALIRPEVVFQPFKPIPPEQTKARDWSENADIPQPIQQINARCQEIDSLGEGLVVTVIDVSLSNQFNWACKYLSQIFSIRAIAT